MRAFLPAILLFLAAAPAAANGKDISAADDAALRVAEARGALIYAYDQAAWHGTDDFRAKAEAMLPQAGGWIVDGPAASPRLVFVDRDATDPKALYVADFRDGKLTGSKVLGDGDDRTLTPARKRMVAALATARRAIDEAKVPVCGATPFNTVTLPPKTPDGPVLVYFLTPQTDWKTIPFGGHYLVPVDASGKAGAVRAYTRSCIAMPIPQKAGKAAKPVALTITHMLDPTPTEIHVFAAYTLRVPVLVVTTDRRLWQVLPQHISLVTTLDKTP